MEEYPLTKCIQFKKKEMKTIVHTRRCFTCSFTNDKKNMGDMYKLGQGKVTVGSRMVFDSVWLLKSESHHKKLKHLTTSRKH